MKERQTIISKAFSIDVFNWYSSHPFGHHEVANEHRLQDDVCNNIYTLYDFRFAQFNFQ